MQPRRTEQVWRAPLVPFATFVTVGILLDRQFSVPLHFSVSAGLACLVAWMISLRDAAQGLSLLYLCGACAAVGAAYHHARRAEVADNDVRQFAAVDARPARLRGVVETEPNSTRSSAHDELRTLPASARTRFVLGVHELATSVDWLHVTGLAQVTLEGRIQSVHVGDRIELVGRMVLPAPPGNPGEFDYRSHLHDQGIGVLVSVPPSAEGITLRAEGWPQSFFGWLGVVRGWGHEVLTQHLPAKYASLAGALVLGEGSGMAADDWEIYRRSGVIHVLAISGQQLIVLGSFLCFLIRLGSISSRKGIVFVAIFLCVYGLMTGGRPPVMRAAWAMAACCGGMWLMRPVLPANTFALAWIVVVSVNPADIFDIGCQLSFLAVAMLFWGTRSTAQSTAFLAWVPFLPKKQEGDAALERLIDESRPLPLAYWLRMQRWLLEFYLVNLTVWLALTPLVAGTQNILSPIALLIGPPLILVTSIAMILGFLLLLTAPLGLAALFAVPVSWCLTACEALVNLGLEVPAAYLFVANLPAWWLWAFYLGLFAFLTVDRWRCRPGIFGPALLAWVVLGVLLVLGAFKVHGFRCTFLAVGHGGCTVLETADGRVILYDAGAITGPEVTRRQIAPYLWHRQIRHIDDLIISHADIDHFNGAAALLERFSVGRVTMTPSFAERSTPATQLTINLLQKHGVPTRSVSRGEVLDEIHAEVLHPPAHGPEGNENARSLVLHVRKASLSILLTGDLEGAGLAEVLAMPPRAVDVLMAPHHGSKASNNAELARWARPKLVVSSQGPPRGDPPPVNPYEATGATYLTTWMHGAVTIAEEEGKCIARTFRSRQAYHVR